MSEIPDDVAKTATDLVNSLPSPPFQSDVADAIARAIAAERERCQKEFAEIIARAMLDKALSDLLDGIDFKKLLGENQGGLINKNPAI